MLAERMKQGIALQDAGRIDDAVRTFEGIVGEDPGVADAWHRLGEITGPSLGARVPRKIAKTLAFRPVPAGQISFGAGRTAH